MPVFVYVCQECKITKERIEHLSDPPPLECPECSKPMEKVVSFGGTFILKGDGFYKPRIATDD